MTQWPRSFHEILEPAERDILNAALEPLSFAAGECIFRGGEPGDSVYLIEQGEVRLEMADPEHFDAERTLGYLEPGSLLGELSLLDGLPRSASAFAQTAVLARRLHRQKWLDLDRTNPQVSTAILRALARDASLKLRESDRRFAQLLSESAADPEIDRAVRQAGQAQRAFESWSEQDVDALLLALAQAVATSAKALAQATVAETRIGNVADKTLKNIHASLGIYQSLAGKPGIGPVGGDPRRGVTEIASPAGVVFGIIPVTNPVATAVFKTLIALKARCAIILSFHRACLGTGNMVCEIMDAVLRQHAVPAHLLQWVRERASRSKTVKFMEHDGVSLILATGGAGMVKSAYSSGKPALGVSPGNAPVYIAGDADLVAAAARIVSSKPFDNGLICGGESNLVVDSSVLDAFTAALESHGAAVLDPMETQRFRSGVTHSDGKRFSEQMIGQSAESILSAIGINRTYPVKLIIIPLLTDEVDKGSPFAKEKLAPLVSLFTATGDADAFVLCRAILALQGAGHTAIIHTQSPQLATNFGLAMPAGRILINAPGVQGICGIATGLMPSYSLGCGTFGGNSTTDNVSYHNLQNIKRLAHVLEHVPSPATMGATLR